jgi:hypothetical protein
MSLKIVNKKKIHDYNAFLPLMWIERHETAGANARIQKPFIT